MTHTLFLVFIEKKQNAEIVILKPQDAASQEDGSKITEIL